MRERLALALQAGQMGVFDLDIVNDSLWWSPQTYDVFGVTPETFTPTRESRHRPDPSGRPAGIRPGPRCRRSPAGSRSSTSTAASGRTAASSGSATAARPSTTPAAGRCAASASRIDITERKLAEQALQEADRKKDSFIATLAHELRNPLAPIRNAVQLLRKSGHDDPQLAWCRDVIDRQVTQMARLLEDLLDVSRLTRGQFALRLRAAGAAGRDRACGRDRPAADRRVPAHAFARACRRSRCTSTAT